jgi:hypothetical protein
MDNIKSIIETMFNEASDEGEKKCPNCGKNPCVCKDNKDEGCCGGSKKEGCSKSEGCKESAIIDDLFY